MKTNHKTAGVLKDARIALLNISYSSFAAGASSALAASGAPESGPRTSAAVALSEDFTSAATLVGSSFAAGFLGTDLETFLAGFALGDALAVVDSASAFFRRAK